MKKIFAVIMSLAMLCSAASAVFADAGELSSVSVSSPKATRTINKTYPSGVSGTMVKTDIGSLMTELDDLTATKDIVQELTISSMSATSLPVNYWLELSLPEESGYAPADTYSAIDYYTIKVENERGTVLYDDASADAKTGETVKLINLGTLNNDKNRTDKATYTLYISVNDAVNTAELSDSLSDVVWSIVYTDDTEQFAPTASPAAASTASPDDTLAASTAVPSSRATSTPAVTTTPTASAAAKTITVNVTTKSDVKDSVSPGSYSLVGIGHVVITDSTGGKKAEFDLTTSDTSLSVTTLKEGDVVTVTGDNNAYIKFKAPAATSTPKVTATPRATSKPTATPRTTTRPTATAKTNPKTGDNAPIIGVSVIAGMALLAVVYIGVTSKKNKNGGSNK